jgi:predicted phosphodiesterase
MQILRKDIVCGKSAKIRIVPIGDIHYGTKNCEVEKLKKLIEWVKNQKDTYVILMGDLCDYINLNDKRFDFSNLDPAIAGRIDDLTRVQADEVIKMLKPISHKILGSIEGNHEQVIHQRYHDNIQAYVCQKLKIKDLGATCFIKLHFTRRGSQERRRVTIYATHGHGSGRMIGGKVNNLVRLAMGIEADVYLMGHVHDLFGTSTIVISPAHTGEHIIQKKRVFGYTGTFYQSYKKDTDSYSERKGYAPNKVGVLKVSIIPFVQYKQGGENRSLPADIHISE